MTKVQPMKATLVEVHTRSLHENYQRHAQNTNANNASGPHHRDGRVEMRLMLVHMIRCVHRYLAMKGAMRQRIGIPRQVGRDHGNGECDSNGSMTESIERDMAWQQQMANTYTS